MMEGKSPKQESNEGSTQALERMRDALESSLAVKAFNIYKNLDDETRKNILERCSAAGNDILTAMRHPDVLLYSAIEDTLLGIEN